MSADAATFYGLRFVRINDNGTITWTFEEGTTPEQQLRIKEIVKRAWQRVCSKLRW